MIFALVMALAVLASSPSEQVLVQPGETLAQVAKRALGDEKAAGELAALNALTGAPAAGTHLKLPGPDRALALSALGVATQAVRQTSPGSVHQKEAIAKLEEARGHFSKARYAEASKAADAAWQLVSASAKEATRFEISVQHNGQTGVRSRSGKAIKVEAQGASSSVYPGHVVTVAQGQPPAAVEASLEPPTLVEPADAHKFEQANGKLAVVLRWEPVPGAEKYEVELSGARSLSIKLSSTEGKLPPLKAGAYRWTVRALDEKGKRGEPSAARAFEILQSGPALEVGKPRWQ